MVLASATSMGICRIRPTFRRSLGVRTKAVEGVYQVREWYFGEFGLPPSGIMGSLDRASLLVNADWVASRYQLPSGITIVAYFDINTS